MCSGIKSGTCSDTSSSTKAGKCFVTWPAVLVGMFSDTCPAVNFDLCSDLSSVMYFRLWFRILPLVPAFVLTQFLIRKARRGEERVRIRIRRGEEELGPVFQLFHLNKARGTYSEDSPHLAF